MATINDSSSDGEFNEENSDDLSYSNLDSIPECLLPRAFCLLSLQLNHNNIKILTQEISHFKNLVSLDISNNGLTYISDEIINLTKLRNMTAKNNALDVSSIPKDFGKLISLECLNMSGNNFHSIPEQFTELSKLRRLYLGGNKIQNITTQVQELHCLEILYLGGNELTEIPAELGHLQNLTSLILCDNKLQSLPPTLSQLHKLTSMSLHNNQLSTLPTEIVALGNLVELSLRNNPLVVKFVEDLIYDPPTLLELAGRVVKIKKIAYSTNDLPSTVVKYLDAAQRCVNPKCKGVFFTAKVEHVKFVDFCGKYRLPLLQYLCSPKCTSLPFHCTSSSDSDTDDEDVQKNKMQKVLLG
ncbi:hypothetical protein CHS0354_038609 [Potamilus streckersoni]|uniref:Leucine-rich repeat-containing protein 58 n=1 Tax=Potamilus streckersoni TaxID=2493646 RepID=A0AAE0TFW4_9BIVA|nr:hypothetical protein CHS0354_038609 [Potamilus streckersoni]